MNSGLVEDTGDVAHTDDFYMPFSLAGVQNSLSANHSLNTKVGKRTELAQGG